ncbi:hypothetical protein SAMN03159495_1036 [Pseudomonas sp. NFR16]|nr:hypothetical protein SAMN03159495_1036 [Pseudomonas sp. NFR16]
MVLSGDAYPDARRQRAGAVLFTLSDNVQTMVDTDGESVN